MIKVNEGTTDRWVRAVLGMMALLSGAVLGGPLGVVAVLVGGLLAVTAVVGWCPLYDLLGVDTSRARR